MCSRAVEYRGFWILARLALALGYTGAAKDEALELGAWMQAIDAVFWIRNLGLGRILCSVSVST